MSLPSPWGDPLGSMRSAEPLLPAGTSPGLPVGFWDTGCPRWAQGSRLPIDLVGVLLGGGQSCPPQLWSKP